MARQQSSDTVSGVTNNGSLRRKSQNQDLGKTVGSDSYKTNLFTNWRKGKAVSAALPDPSSGSKG